MNPMYQMFMNGMTPQAPQASPMPQVPPAVQQMQNMMAPMRQAMAVWQSMRNPAAFVKWQFPDVPDEIAGDANKVLAYLQQTRNISNEQLNQFASQFQLPRF